MRTPMNQRGLGGCLLAALTAALLAGPAPAQDPPRKVAFSYRVDPNPKDTDKTLPILYLRPNTAHTVAFSIHNEDATQLSKGVVKLVRLEGKRVEVLAAAPVVNVGKKAKASLTFAKVSAPPPKEPKEPPDKEPAKDKGPKEKEDPEFKITGPRHTLQLWLEEAEMETAKHDLYLWFRHPASYIKAEASYDRDQKRLNFGVEMDKNIIGTPVTEVELSFFPDLKTVPDAVLKRKLTEPGKKLQMFVDNLEFDETAALGRSQRIFVKVDGFDRAFEFMPAFEGSGKLESIDYRGDVAVRYRVPRYTLPTDKLEVTLEIDGPIDQVARVEYGWNPTGTKDSDQFQPREKLGLRDARVKFDVADGDLVILTKVRDWKVDINTEGAQGRGLMRVGVVRDSKGVERENISKDALAPFQRASGYWSPLTLEDNYAFAPITLDKTLPESVTLIALPKEAQAGKALVLQATAKPRDESRHAPIDRVIFHLGKPQAEGKIPPELIQKEGVLNVKTGIWTAELPSGDKLGPTDVTVQFEMRTAKKATATGVVILRDLSKDVTLTTIRGTLVKGSAAVPERAIYLMDTKLWQMNDPKAQKDMVKTDAKGQFEFKDVPPGSYTVAASEPGTRRVGRTPVQVPAGKQLIDNVSVSLLLE